MSDELILTIPHDDALVLFELFARFSESNQFALRHNSEFIALSRISALLDKSLVEPFLPNYDSLLEQARSRVSAGFEGVAPGVSYE